MGKKVITATEMKDADVQFISLVNKAANRIPFRILKSEESGMINLSGIFKTKKSEPAKVLAVLVDKEADLGAAKALIEEKTGETVHKIDSDMLEDATVMSLVEGENGFAGCSVVKASENVGLVIANVQKGFDSWPDGTDFNENVKTNGFFPGVFIALDTFEDTVRNAMFSSDAPPTEVVAKACDDFKNYCLGLVRSLPQTAFKMDGVSIAKKADAPAKKEEEAGTEAPAADAGAADAGTEESAKKGDEPEAGKQDTPPAEPAKKEDGKEAAAADNGEIDTAIPGARETAAKADKAPAAEQAAAPAAAEPAKKGGAPADDDPTTKITQKMDDQFNAMTARFKELSDSLEAVAKEAKEAKDLAQKSEETLGNLTLNGSDTDTVQKSETTKKSGGGVFDTAFHFPGMEG